MTLLLPLHSPRKFIEGFALPKLFLPPSCPRPFAAGHELFLLPPRMTCRTKLNVSREGVLDGSFFL